MKYSILLFMLIVPTLNSQCQELFEITSGIKISNSISQNPEPGIIRWTGSDFQGYNGNQWISLTSTNTSIVTYFIGLPNGIQTLLNAEETIPNILSAGAAPTDFLGLEYLGGYIFQLNNDGTGMMTTKNDYQSRYGYGCHGVAIVGASGSAIGTGVSNTAAIVNGCIDAAEPYNAAKICDSWNAHDLTDWFLPSRNEFELMYSVLGQGDNIGSFDIGIYWTSTQFSNAFAYSWVNTGSNNYFNITQKSLLGLVRPIRNF